MMMATVLIWWNKRFGQFMPCMNTEARCSHSSSKELYYSLKSSALFEPDKLCNTSMKLEGMDQ